MSSNNFASGQVITGSSVLGSSVAIVSSSLPAGMYVTGANNVTGVLNVLPVAQYNSAQLTLNDRQFMMLQATLNGYLRTTEQFVPVAEDNANGVIAVTPKVVVAATYAPTRTGTLNAVSTAFAKATAGNLISLYVCNQNYVGDVYIQMFNQTTAPTNGTAPTYFYSVPPRTTAGPGTLNVGMETLSQAGDYFSTGIAWALSSTSGTLNTLVASQSLGVAVQLRYA